MYYLDRCWLLFKKYLLSQWFHLQNDTSNDNSSTSRNNDKLLVKNTCLVDTGNVSLSYDISKLPTVDETIVKLQPTVPLHCIRPKTLETNAINFLSSFPGEVLYAVKCNPDPIVLHILWNSGIHHFDCASIREIQLIHSLFPSAKIHFMHPIKSKNAIYEAYFKYGVRDFAFDSIEEFNKIVAQTKNANDLGLFLRVKMAKQMALYDLSVKFGVSIDDAIEILKKARPVAKYLGICFHVGSQCMKPESYETALGVVKDIITQANVEIDIIDVGGGFPGSYLKSVPPPLDTFFSAITRSFNNFNLPKEPSLWCEPGRALVYSGCSLVVSVITRKQKTLYINDGVLGSLCEAVEPVNEGFPARLVRLNKSSESEEVKLEDFIFYGPTCDNYDLMDGPFTLPEDVHADDYIEIGNTGAYNFARRTFFNGFDEHLVALVSDDPLPIDTEE